MVFSQDFQFYFTMWPLTFLGGKTSIAWIEERTYLLTIHMPGSYDTNLFYVADLPIQNSAHKRYSKLNMITSTERGRSTAAVTRSPFYAYVNVYGQRFLYLEVKKVS